MSNENIQQKIDKIMDNDKQIPSLCESCKNCLANSVISDITEQEIDMFFCKVSRLHYSEIITKCNHYEKKQDNANK